MKTKLSKLKTQQIMSCKKCFKKFNNLTELYVHVRKHNTKTNQKSNTLNNLQSHTLTNKKSVDRCEKK